MSEEGEVDGSCRGFLSHHTVGGLRAQTQDSDERPFEEIRGSGIGDAHWNKIEDEATD